MLASSLAHQISGRPQLDPIEVRCEGETDWANLHQTANELGYVRFVLSFSWRDGFMWEPGNLAEFSPQTCYYLNQFALADPKPTKCATAIPQTTTVMKKVTHTITKRVKVKGKWVKKKVTTTVSVPVAVTTTVPGPAAPCPLVPGAAFPSDYNNYVWALWTLAHESIHLANVQNEAKTNCYGMQWVTWTASQLGATPDDASAIAGYLWTTLYPWVRANNPPYWTPDCYPGGPLDLSPGDNVWP